MTDEKDEQAVEPIDDQTHNIEDAVVVEDAQEVDRDEPSEDAVADAVEAIDTERKSSGVIHSSLLDLFALGLDLVLQFCPNPLTRSGLCILMWHSFVMKRLVKSQA